MATLVYLVCC